MNDFLTQELMNGLKTAYIDGTWQSNLAYKPQFVSNNPSEGKKVLSTVEEELLRCDSFRISVAFVTMGGITPLLQTLKELEQKVIPGEILTTNYLHFSEPRALKKLNEFSNITVKMYDVEDGRDGFHTKGYIFREREIYRVIIGSSNLTSAALTTNREWNLKMISTQQGETAQEILREYCALWNSKRARGFDDFYEDYWEHYRIIQNQRKVAQSERIVSLENYKLQPNQMQVAFITNLKKIINAGSDRALLISATGTGKTFASAFAMRELGFKRVLFLVHRGQLAVQTKKSYERVFGNTVSMGLVSANHHEYDKDYIFATIQTMNRDAHLFQYAPDTFDAIILDESHHALADTYQKVMRYFKPRLWLGMTATPDRRDDARTEQNLYEIFHYNIACEIRLQQAMEANLLCPFHYFGLTDLSLLDDRELRERKLNSVQFNQLVGEQRVNHIIEQANYYGYSGSRVKGLIFCSRLDEARAFSVKFNEKGFRTVALSGDSAWEEREECFERLAMDENDETDERRPLDYIFSVEILNEGVDIVEVNQVIMLRPTQSPIIFIQQLGRGLRKAVGKEYVVILDFIGNYTNNFLIPVALSGDRSYNPDNIRKYVISGNSVIPGASTVHFDEIAKERIFSSIDKMKGLKTIIRDSYATLKNRLGRIPTLLDFYENGEVDPLIIIREYKSYAAFLQNVEPVVYGEKFTEQELITLEYLSKTVLSGTRPTELEILREIQQSEQVSLPLLKETLTRKYGYDVRREDLDDAAEVLEGKFVSKEEELRKYGRMEILTADSKHTIHRLRAYAERLTHPEFYSQLETLVEVGLRRYREKYNTGERFVLYEKYSRRDVCLLMNCGKDLSSTMYGMKRIGNDVFIFVTYHKGETQDTDKEYIEGKPDYADAFEDACIFRWDSQIGRGVDSAYVHDVMDAAHKHLLVKKSDAETGFYYMGEFDVLQVEPAVKKDNTGKLRDIAKFRMRMRHAVREDLLRYLQSNVQGEIS